MYVCVIILMQKVWVSGAEQEYSLLKAKIKHSRVWSPDGWVTVTC